MRITVVVLVCVLIAGAFSEVRHLLPLAVPPSGYHLNPSSSSSSLARPAVILEVFLELNCRHSGQAWELLKQLANVIPRDLVEIQVHWLPLPFHRHAWMCTRGFHVMRELSPSNAGRYVDEVFANLEHWSTSGTINRTDTQVLELLATKVEQLEVGITAEQFQEKNSHYQAITRAAWKMAVSRGVASVPTFYLNGVPLSFTDLEVTSWKDYLEGLLQEHGVMGGDDDDDDDDNDAGNHGGHSASAAAALASRWKFW